MDLTIHNEVQHDAKNFHTAASLLHERLSTLSDVWECELLFNELPPSTRHVLQVTEPTSPLLSATVDLCKYMDKRTCLQDRITNDYPNNTAYRFPDCYKGLTNYGLLHQQLLMSAVNSNYSICLRTTQKAKQKMLFVCQHGRLYNERFGKQLPMSSNAKRATYTHRSMEKSRCCPFSFTVFHCAEDDYWYLSNFMKRSVSNKMDNVNIHRYHPKLGDNHITPSIKTMDKISLGIARHAATLHVSQSVTAMLLQQTTKQQWLPEQLRYVTKHAKKLMSDVTGDNYSDSSADRLISYLRKQVDVSYVLLSDEPNTALLSDRGKGRPRNKANIQITLKSARNTATANVPQEAHDDAIKIRESLKIRKDQSMLLAVAWVTDKEAKFAQKFPEVFFVDATSSTNVEKRELVLICGKDSTNAGFTAMRVFVPSEKQWVYSWIYLEAIPLLLGKKVTLRNRLVLTDGDRNNYIPFENCIRVPNSGWCNSSHGLCEWHLLGQSWQKQVAPTVQRDDAVKTICATCINWIKTWFWKVESQAEFELSKDQLFDWLLEMKERGCLPSITYNAIRDLVIQQLLPVVHKWGRHYRHQMQGVMHDVTTSIVESQNSATKGNHSYSVKCQMTLDTSLETLTAFGRNYIDRKMQRSATHYSKTSLNSNSLTKSYLTEYAERIIMSNDTRSTTYYCVKNSATTWLICSKKSIDALLMEETMTVGAGTKFVRVREITMTKTADDNVYQLHCSCCFYTRTGLPCAHIQLLCHQVEPSMCKVRWWKVYHYSYLNDEEVTEEIDKFLEKEYTDPIKISVSKDNIRQNSTSCPLFGEGVTEYIYEVMVAIHNNLAPVTYSGPYATPLHQQLPKMITDISQEFSTFCYEADENNYTNDYSGPTAVNGMQSEFSLSQERYNMNKSDKELFIVDNNEEHKNRYSRCMAAVNEVLKVSVESEENTNLFITTMNDLHKQMLEKFSTTVQGETVTCCLSLESRKHSKRKKTMGYI